MTLIRLALPAFFLTWVLIAGLLIYGWLRPHGVLSDYWLESWYQLLLGLMGLAAILIGLVLRHHRQTLNVLADAMPDMVEHGVGYQIRDAKKYGDEVVLFNRLSRRLAATLTQLDGERQLLRETLDNINTTVVVIDGQGRIELVTPYAEHAFGWRAGQLTDHPISLLLPHYAEILSEIAADRRTDQPAGPDIQSVALCENGENRSIALQIHPRQQGNGQVLLLRDMTAELDAHSEAVLLKTALDSSPLRIMLFDSADQLIWASQTASEMLSRQPDTLIQGQSYISLMTRAVVTGIFPDAVADPESWLQAAQQAHNNADQRRIQLEEGCQLNEQTVITEQQNSLTLFTEVGLATATEAQQPGCIEGDRFMSVIRHGLYAPLQGIIGLLTLLQREADPDKREHYVITALETATKQAHLISNLLDLARLDTDTLQLNSAPCALPALIQSLVDEVSPQATEKSLQLSVTSRSTLPEWVELDGARLHQVLLNLLTNAVQFTEQGEVRLDTEIQKEQLCFTVTDTGTGISPRQQQQLFTPFITDSDHNHDGIGLGLAISQRLLEKMGGQLQFSPTADGGSQFRFELALSVVEAPDNQQSDSLSEPPILIDSTLQPVTNTGKL